MPGASTTCMGMCGNGAGTKMSRNLISLFCVAARSSMNRKSLALPTGSSSIRSSIPSPIKSLTSPKVSVLRGRYYVSPLSQAPADPASVEPRFGNDNNGLQNRKLAPNRLHALSLPTFQPLNWRASSAPCTRVLSFSQPRQIVIQPGSPSDLRPRKPPSLATSR